MSFFRFQKTDLKFRHIPHSIGNRETFLVYETSNPMHLCHRFIEGDVACAELDAYFVASVLEYSISQVLTTKPTYDQLRWGQLKRLVAEFPHGFNTEECNLNEQTGELTIPSATGSDGIVLRLDTPVDSWRDLSSHILEAVGSYFEKVLAVERESR